MKSNLHPSFPSSGPAHSLRAINLPCPPALNEFVRQRLRKVTDRFGAQIDAIDVTFTDLNGARGGVDKHCRIALTLIPRGRVIATAEAASVAAAVVRAIKRARTLLVAQLRQSNPRRPGGLRRIDFHN